MKILRAGKRVAERQQQQARNDVDAKQEGRMTPREHIGYFEDFLLVREGLWPKGLGSRNYGVELPPEQQGRKLGHAGLRRFALTENVTLNKGHRKVVLKASAKKPLVVETMLQRMEGREIR